MDYIVMDILNYQTTKLPKIIVVQYRIGQNYLTSLLLSNRLDLRILMPGISIHRQNTGVPFWDAGREYL